MRTNLLDRDALLRFLAMRTETDAATGCHVWQRSVQRGGYARVVAPWGGTIAVHRLVYLVLVGPLREDLEVHHHCGNRRCCNPEHLIPLGDLAHKRADVNWVGNRTHCIRGHPLSGDNLSAALLKRGIRRCKQCSALKMREARRTDPEKALEAGRQSSRRRYAEIREDPARMAALREERKAYMRSYRARQRGE